MKDWQDRLEEKLDKIDEKVDNIRIDVAAQGATLMENKEDVAEHIRRTNLLEKKVDKHHILYIIVTALMGAVATPIAYDIAKKFLDL